MTSDPNTPRTSATASQTADKAKDAGRDLKDEARHEAQNLRDQAAAHLQSRADGAKETLAHEVSSIGKALRRASDELRDGSPQEQAFSSAASALAEFADSIQGKDLGGLMHDMGDFGRRNPVAFLGGAALLGFAGARLAKAHRPAGRPTTGSMPTGGTPAGTSTPGTTTGGTATGTTTGSAGTTTTGTPGSPTTPPPAGNIREF